MNSEQASPRPPGRSRRRIGYGIAFAGLLCLVTLAASELLARAVLTVRDPLMNMWPDGYYVPQVPCGYAPARGYPRRWMTERDGRTKNLVYTNSMGMRDIEPPAPDAKQLRILALGCSQTEGLAISDPSEPWPRRFQEILESRMEAPGLAPVVMNAGVVGYNTFQQAAHGASLAPEAKADLWLMAYLGGPTGMWLRNTYGMKGQARLRWGELFQAEYVEAITRGRSPFGLWMLDRSALWRWIVFRASLSKAADAEAREFPGKEQESTEKALAEFQSLARAAGARPIVLYLPSMNEIEAACQGEDSKILPQVEGICAKLGLDFADATPGMIERARGIAAEGKLRSAWAISEADLHHYNPAANSAFAQSAADALGPLLENQAPRN